MTTVIPMDKELCGRVQSLKEQLEQVRRQRSEMEKVERKMERVSLLESEREFWMRTSLKMKAALAETTADNKKQMTKLMVELDKLKEKNELLDKASKATSEREMNEKNVQRTSCGEQKDKPEEAESRRERLPGDVFERASSMINAQIVADVMYQRRFLTRRELESIQSLSSCPIKAAETLLDIAVNQTEEFYECFLESLKLSNHQHVYEWIVSENYRDLDTQIAHNAFIRDHYLYLIENMDTKYTDLVVRLYDEKVLQDREQEDIAAEPTSTRKNEKLLSVLSRKSGEQWELFLKALENSGQGHLITGHQSRLEKTESDLTEADILQSQDREIQLMATLKDAHEKVSEMTKKATAASDLADDLKRQLMLVNDREADLQRQLELIDDKEAGWMKQLKDDQEKQRELRQQLDEMNRFMSQEHENMKNITELREQLARSSEAESRLRLELKQTEGMKEKLKGKLKSNSKLIMQLAMATASARVDELETPLAAAKQRETELTEKLRISEDGLFEYKKRCVSEEQENNQRLNILREQLTRSAEVESRLRMELEQTTGMKEELKKQLASVRELSIQLGTTSARADELETLLTTAKQKEAELTEQLMISEARHREHRKNASKELVDLKSEYKVREQLLEEQLIGAKSREDVLKQHMKQSRYHEHELLERNQHIHNKLFSMVLGKDDLKMRISQLLELLLRFNFLSEDEEKSVKILKTRDQKDTLVKILNNRSVSDYRNLLGMPDRFGDEQSADAIRDPDARVPAGHAPDSADHPTTTVMPVKTLSKAAPGGNQIYGVCVVGDKLYVARSRQSALDIYDRRTMTSIGGPPVTGEGSNWPGCMVYDSDRQLFYISYYKAKIVRRMWLADGDCKAWPVTSEPDGVAVTSRGVLVTFRNQGKLGEFEPEGKLIRDIRLDNAINQPRHAIPYGANGFLICFGFTGGKCGMCLADEKGNVVKFVDSRTEHPLHVEIGRNNCVFVADFIADKVTILDSRLEYVMDAIPKGVVHQPFRLCVDKDCVKLYVGDFGGGCREFDIAYE